MNNAKPSQLPNQSKRHYVRTFFASIFGILASVLILASILVVWANHTLTDTNAYTKTVAPLVTKPEIQGFIAERATDKVLESAPVQDLADGLLASTDRINKTPDELLQAVHPVVRSSIFQVLSSPRFANVWERTNREAHAQFVQQLKSNSSTLSLDLSPIITSIVDELKTTRLASIADKIELNPDDVRLNLQGSGIDKAHKYYRWSQDAVVGLVALTIALVGLAAWISVHHTKTLRRIALGTGISSAILTVALYSPSFIKPSGPDSDAQNAGLAVAGSVLGDLRLATLVIAAVCIVGAIASKVYSRRRSAST